MSKPQEEYIRILYRINDTYSRYDIDKYDIQDEINEYESKNKYSDKDLILFETKCFDEWYKLIVKICNKTISFIESKKIYEERLLKERKRLKKILAKLNMTMTFEKYDKIYEEICDILDDIKVTEKILKRSFKERVIDMSIGAAISLIVTIIGGIILFKIGFI